MSRIIGRPAPMSRWRGLTASVLIMFAVASAAGASMPVRASGAASAQPQAGNTAAQTAAVLADENLTFGSLITALSPAPAFPTANPSDMALQLANGSADVVENGQVTSRLGPTPWPVTSVQWVANPCCSGFVLVGRSSTVPAATGYFVTAPDGGRQSGEQSLLPLCPGATAPMADGGDGIAWRCGSQLDVETPFVQSWSYRQVDTFTLPAPESYPLGTASPAAMAPDPRDPGTVAVQNGAQLTVLRPDAAGPVGSLVVGSAPARIAWSSRESLAVAGSDGVFLWDRVLGVKRFAAVPDPQAVVWTPDGLHAVVLGRLNPGTEPPQWIVERFGFDGSRATLARGRLGYVLGLSGDGGYLWREEGVAPTIYSSRAPDPGPGPFTLQAVALPAVPPSGVQPLPTLGAFVAADSRTMWALGTAGNGTVLRSTDGGQTWSGVTPGGYSIAATSILSPLTPPATGAVPSSSIAVGLTMGTAGRAALLRRPGCAAAGAACYAGWFVAAPTGASGVAPFLLYTPDGGATWQPLDPQGVNLSGPWSAWPQLDFVSTSDGWLLTFPCCDQRDTVDLYRTTDGGRTWVPIGAMHFWTPLQDSILNSGTIGALAAGVTPPPNGAMQPGPTYFAPGWLASTGTNTGFPGSPAPAGVPRGMTFRDTQTGWLTGVAPKTPWLYATTNGGATWQNVRLPLPAGVSAGTLTETLPPQFFDAEDGVLPVIFSVKWLAGSGYMPWAHAQLALYRTSDGGATWQPTTPLALPGQSYDLSNFLVDPLDAAHTWASTGITLYATADGGGTWTTVAQHLNAGWQTTLQFTDPDHGWALWQRGLMSTSDGGRRWTPVTARLEVP